MNVGDGYGYRNITIRIQRFKILKCIVARQVIKINLRGYSQLEISYNILGGQ
jgi:hypothetical protein